MTNTIMRNANYTGDDAETIKWQAKGDAFAVAIGKRRLKQDSTLSALDRLLIQEIPVLWDIAFDALDRETFLDLMTDDVVYRSNVFGDADGREQMGAWWDNFTKTFNGKRHLLTNFVIVGDGHHAMMFSYLTVFERIEHTDMVGTCVYNDEFTKDAKGIWKMSKRTQILDPGMTKTKSGQALLTKYAENSKK